MKITCQACQAKYTIADEKVVGKVVKIRCKKCGATIVVNGNDPSATTTTSSPPDAPSGGDGEAAEGWTVNVAEGDQRTMSDEEVVAAYRSGIVDDETYCWKDGMDDWLPLREIAALYDACGAGTESKPASAQSSGAAGRASNGSGANPAPVTARRAAGRAPAADLFGGVAQAGGEDDVMTSAPAKVPQAHEDAKLIGARNENSVLFSLNTLTGKSDRPPAPPVDSEASGLIDIRQLSAQIGTVDDSKKKGSRVDDIMNLSSGGAFSPTLTAPALAAPPIESYSSAADKGSMAPGSRGRGMLVLALLGGLLVIALAVGGAVTLMRGKGDETADKDRPASSASAAGIAAPSGASAVASAGGAPTEEAPSASAAASAASKEAPSAAPSAAVAAAAPTQHTAPAAAPVHEAPHAAPAAAAESDQPFNMGEARARLAAVAGAVQSCKKPNGPTGTGRVLVVFAPSGAAQSAAVSGDPFEGTPTGGCVANHFRAVRVPAFGGSPFSVTKSFTIN
jgi:predicted Zn finger-like uncharacterized protein